MIQNPDLTRYRNGEFVKFTDNVASIISNYDTSALQIQPEAEQFKTNQSHLKTIYKVDRGSNLTLELVKTDKFRDDMFSAVRQILSCHKAYHPDENIRVKAEKLLTIFEKHGTDLNVKSYQEQSAGLDDIIKTVENDGSTEDLKLLDIDVYYNNLKSSNVSFDRLFLERNKEYAETPKEKMSELRDQVTADFDTLKNKINAYIIINGISAYESLVNELNSLIDTYEQNLEKRTGNATEQNEEVLDQDFEEINE